MTTLAQQPFNESLVFQMMSASQVDQLKVDMKSRRLKANKHLFREGEPANHFFELLSGTIRLYRLSPEGDEKVFQQVTAGSMLAEAAMFMSPNQYPVSAKAEYDCELNVYSRDALIDLCTSSSDFSLNLLTSMSVRLHQVLNRVDQLTLKNAGQRLVVYLLEQYQQQKTQWLTLPVSRSILATQLNIAPETLSRLFSKFKSEETISGKRQTVVLMDIDKMCYSVGLPSLGQLGGLSSSMAGCCSLT